MRELLDSNGIVTDVQFSLIQLVEMGLCSYHELKDGSLSYRDVIVLLNYTNVKNAFALWKRQHEELKHKRI